MDNQNQANQTTQAVSRPATSATPANSFPSIGQLFKDSWQTFTQSILQLFLLNILGLVGFLGLAVLGVVIAILSGIGSSLLQKGSLDLLTLLTSPSTVILMIVIGLVFLLALIIISSALQIASILVVDNQGKTPILTSFKKSFGFIIPLSLVGILTFFLSFGAFFVLFLPAMLFAFLLVFVQFEVILNNQRWTQAVKRSVVVVSKHFGAIFLRLLLLWLIGVGVFIFFSITENILPENSSWLISVPSFIFNLLFGWFWLAYTITLYKQARVSLEQEPGKSILWMWLVAILGWLIAAGLFFTGYKVISSGILNNLTSPPAPVEQQPDFTTSEFDT